ncbi:hypothetical protein GTZ99_08575 [Novosphingobium sp. FSY-8]|uniref:Uncharacterized protein n=1 Tax=Novosphingobium ovatum TaxID=1908523 RepID=A0ABW9XDJ6_9SPHN|nr:hypothetical protein [Novosphingobium ovatum]NBC36611.1 hypothetical protein [Novosphingobium ovatum]
MHKAIWFAAVMALSAPAYAQTAAPAAPACNTLDSPAGKAWARANAWRYADPARAAAVYRDLADSRNPSPWPDGIAPQWTVLPTGTRFQMAIAKGQIQPDGTIWYGGFGTFDRIDSTQQVRDWLAVRSDFKGSVDFVLTLEVVQPLPALVGPIGPQVEPAGCKLLPGGGMQLQMVTLPKDRAAYLKVIEQRPVQ